MATPMRDLELIQVLLERLGNERLPRAIKLKRRVDGGDCLDDYDMRFLAEVFRDAASAGRLSEKYPEFQSLVVQLTMLYRDITRQAMENEFRTPLVRTPTGQRARSV